MEQLIKELLQRLDALEKRAKNILQIYYGEYCDEIRRMVRPAAEVGFAR